MKLAEQKEKEKSGPFGDLFKRKWQKLLRRASNHMLTEVEPVLFHFSQISKFYFITTISNHIATTR